jgi:hypothetical protein
MSATRHPRRETCRPEPPHRRLSGLVLATSACTGELVIPWDGWQRRSYTGRVAFTCLAACVEFGCGSPRLVGGPSVPCPSEGQAYVPSGHVITDETVECDDGCLFECQTPACDGPPGTIWCEACEDLDAFMAGPCVLCAVGTTDEGVLRVVCGGGK